MSVLIVTSVGDIVVDLHSDRMKYYNGCLFHKVEKDFLAQSGDRTGTGTGGDSVYKFLYGDQARFFDDEIHPELKHSRTGTLAMASAGENLNASQFYFTLRDDIDYLDGKHTVFGVVEEKEGLDTLAKINEAYVDSNKRPYKDIRIKHTYILDDPFDDPPQLSEFIPEKSPEGKLDDEIVEERLEDDWVPLDDTLGPEEIEERLRSKEAHTNAAILESIGDIPDADVKPPENVLFVCKLNPVTQDEDLHTIFSRFGTVTSADIIRDYKTGDSLCYAFIEFESNDACERAYFKMDNTLIDDRRIHVDFSQSVSRLWNQYRHGKRGNSDKGCFKCGALDHLAKNCDNDTENKQKGNKYVLKDDSTQRGGHQHESYDMLFDEDNLEDQREDRSGKTKKPKYSTERDRNSDRQRHKDYIRSGSELNEKARESQRYDDHYKESHRRRHESSRHAQDSDDQKRSYSHHVKDTGDRNERDRHRRNEDERLRKRRSRDQETDHRRERSSRDREDKYHKERSYREERR
ncbi:peptidyl-prolyl cis-trans isomerase CYP59-like isoform X2 [Zingiber officinale]|uniref:peptidyl-prolyl cis-trans isomerase CYP59-like isoform X2 n=1 Tax=Zingiber officinale TaxID=94328 RepID=UPI001C4B501D|nr:peptidyl-prolyl cis-trans isomerase CYP59-like isoform X2 [Zingiber officinale]